MPRTKKKAVAKKAVYKKTVEKKPVAEKAAEKSVKEEVKESAKTILADKAIVHSVTLSAGSTLNLGDYESARFDVGLTISAMDSDTTPEELAEVGWAFIREELASKVKAVRNKKAK